MAKLDAQQPLKGTFSGGAHNGSQAGTMPVKKDAQMGASYIAEFWGQEPAGFRQVTASSFSANSCSQQMG